MAESKPFTPEAVERLERVVALYRALFPPGTLTDQFDAAWEALKADELAEIRRKLSLHELRQILGVVVPAVCKSMIAKADG